MTALRNLLLSPQLQSKLLILLLPLYFIGLIYGKFILSLAMILLIILSLARKRENNPNLLISDIERFLRSPAWWIITGYFFIVLFGGWYSDDTTSWLIRLRIKLPFLILPFCFYILPRPVEKDYHKYIFLFVTIVFLSTIPILFSILTDLRTFLSGLSQGLTADTPVNHIRYSLMLAMGCFGAIILFLQRFHVFSKKEILIYLGVGIYLFLFIHLIAVRSGIICLYLTAFIWALRFLWKKQTRIRGMALTLAICGLPFIMISIFPSMKNRWEYMVNDYNQFRAGQWNAYSDSERILSLNAGLEIIKDYPWWGVGPGDLKNVCSEKFFTLYDKTTFLLPHNQFIYVASGSGLIGFVIFVLAFFVPVFRFIRSPEPFWISCISIVFFSLLVENTLETAVGTGLFILPLLMGMRYQDGRELGSETRSQGSGNKE